MSNFSTEYTLLKSTIPALVGYTFTGDATDITYNSLDGTVTGATLSTDRFNQANGCYLLDWTNDKIAIGNAGTVKSISMWVNIVDITATDQLFEGSANAKYILSTAWTLSSDVFTDFYVDWVATTTITAWRHHLVVTVAAGTDVSAGTIGLYNTDYWNFYVDDFYAFSVVLSAAQVLSIYNQQRQQDVERNYDLVKYAHVLSTDYANSIFTLSSAGTGTFTIKFCGSMSDTKPNFAAAASATNRRDYVEVNDYEDGTAIDWDTWVAYVADVVRAFELNTNAMKRVWAVITSYTAGTITLNYQWFSN